MVEILFVESTWVSSFLLLVHFFFLNTIPPYRHFGMEFLLPTFFCFVYASSYTQRCLFT